MTCTQRRFPQEDVVDGLMYVIEHAEQLGVDKRSALTRCMLLHISRYVDGRHQDLQVQSPSGVIVQGESAGGHLAVLASLLVPSGLVP